MRCRATVAVVAAVAAWGLGGCVLPEGERATLPTTSTGEALGPLLKPTAVYPEKYRVVEWVGKVVDLRDDLGVGRESRSVFVPQTGQGYFILLENAALGELEKYTRHGEKVVKVTGTVTLYGDRNYLLLGRWTRQEY